MTRHPICFDATGTLIELNEGVGEVYHRVALEHGVDLPAWRLEDAFLRILRRAPARGVEGETVAARRQGELDWWFERVRETFQATDSTACFSNFPTFATGAEAGILVNDTMNYRIKKFGASGDLLAAFGEEGNGPGTFSRPKGVAEDEAGNEPERRDDRVAPKTGPRY